MLPYFSLWCSDKIVLLGKMDDTCRFCVDYRTVNEVTGRDAHWRMSGFPKWHEIAALTWADGFDRFAWLKKETSVCYQSWSLPVYCHAVRSYQFFLPLFRCWWKVFTRIAVGLASPSLDYIIVLGQVMNRPSKECIPKIEKSKFKTETKEMHLIPNQSQDP